MFVRRKYNKYLPGPSNDKVRWSPSWAPLVLDKPVIDNVMLYVMGTIFSVIDCGGGVLKINVERLQIMLGLPGAF